MKLTYTYFIINVLVKGIYVEFKRKTTQHWFSYFKLSVRAKHL